MDIPVTVIDDRIFDPNESIIITLEDSQLYNIGTSSAELTIIDDEPNITLDATDAIEGGINGEFIFNLDPNAPNDARQLSFSITGGTAELGTDYRLLDVNNNLLTADQDGNFLLDISGQSSIVVKVDATGIPGSIPDFDENIDEGIETVEITLNDVNDINETEFSIGDDGNPNNNRYGGGGSKITVNIIDNDTPPTVEVVAGNNPTETNSTPGFFDLNFSNPIPSNGIEKNDEDAIFNFTIDGSATLNEDYNLVLVANGTDQNITANSFSLPEGTTAARIKVQPVDDNVFEPDETVTFNLSLGEGYILGATTSQTLTIEDSGMVSNPDIAGVRIIESQGSTDLIEGQTTDNYTIELTSQPTSDVTISFATDETQVNSINSVTFTPENWNIRQNITVTSVDDNIVTSDRTSTISHSATSNDLTYQGIAINDVVANITENDVPGIVIGNGRNLQVIEGGNGLTYNIALTSQPVADVTINFGISNDLQAIAPITFTPDNWDIPQDVTVTATIDTEVEPIEIQNISHIISSSDPVYNGLPVDDVPIAISELSFNNIETARGLNESLNSLQDSIDAQFRAIELPFIGSLATLAPNLIGSFQATLINRVQTGGVLNLDNLTNLVETSIEDALGVDAIVTPNISLEEATFDITVAKQYNLASIALDADLGLPGLGIDVDGTADLTFDYEFGLGFGISQEFGFFVDTEKTSFSAGVDLGLSDNFQASGNLGFLALDLENDADNPTAVSADFTLGLNDIDAGEDLDGNRLTTTELLNASPSEIPELFNPSLTANANLGLSAVTSVQGNAAFPAFNFDLAGDFPILNYEDGEVIEDQAPNIAFNNVQLDLGTFLTDFAQPVIGRINDIIDPFRPVIDFLNTDTQILSQLGIADFADTDGDGKVSVLELALKIAEFGGSTRSVQFQDFFNAIEQLSDLAADLSTPIGNNESIIIELGSYELGSGFDASDPNADTSSVTANQTTSRQSLEQQLNNAPNTGSRDTQKEITRNLTASGGDFELPLLTNPFTAIDLLLGKDVPIFTYDLPALEVGFNVRREFPIFPPIFGLIEGGFDVGLDLAFGFDTFGFSQWSATDFDPTQSFRVLDGFYVSDRENADGTGADVAELTANASIAVGAGLNVGVASGYVKGGIEGLIELDLIDRGEVNGTDDGRLRGSEIAERISTPFELFQLDGAVNAFLGAEVNAFGANVFDARLATFQLAEFSVGGTGNSSSSVSDGVISGGKAFFDADFDAIHDPNEPFTFTSEDGSYNLEIPLYNYDLNGNGVIDPEEGRVVIVDGIDISTSLPQTAPIITTPNGTVATTVATPITSLITKIAEPDLDAAQAEVIRSFGLTSNSNLYDNETATTDLSVFGIQSQLQNLIILATQTIGATAFAGETINGSQILTQNGLIYLDNNDNGQFDDNDLEVVLDANGDRFFDVNSNAVLDSNELSSTVNNAEIATAILREIANRVNNSATPDLSDTDTVEGIINQAVTTVIAQDPNTSLDGTAISDLAATIVEKNRTIDNILGNNGLSETEQRQLINNQWVFIDTNGNGLQDSDEPFSVVTETGSDNLDITTFDTNGNGELDVRVVVTDDSPDYVFFDSNANGVHDKGELFSIVNPSGDNNLEIDFIDSNDNGVQDDNESFLITSPLRTAEVAIAPFDLNSDGVLEPEERANVILEGTPLSQWSFVDSNGNAEYDRGELFSIVYPDGTDALDPFVEGAKVYVEGVESPELVGGFQYLVTNVLTTLSRLVAKPGDITEAQEQVKAALGLPDVDLLNFDPLLEASSQDPNWLEVYAKQVQIQNTIVQIGALTGEAETATIDALSEMITNSGSVDLRDSTQIEQLILEVAPSLELNTVQGAAIIITEDNQRIDNIVDPPVLQDTGNIVADPVIEDRAKSIEIVRVQEIAQGRTREDLEQVRLGTTTIEEVLNANTGTVLFDEGSTDNTDNIEEVVDPTKRPDLSNSVPVAEPDIATTNVVTPVTINVLNNDSDADNDAIEIGNVFASDNGEVVINPDNTLTYTPNSGFVGEDTIFYTIQDSNENVDNSTVTITVNPNQIVAGAGVRNILGTEEADDITGNETDNSIDGAAGNDIISGGAGNDTISGGAGNDTLDGGEGDDYLIGSDLTQVLNLDGNDDYVEIPSFNNFPTTEITLEGWFQKTQNQETPSLFSYAVTGSSNEVLLEEQNSQLRFLVGNHGIDTGIAIPDEDWHHWAVTWRSSDGQVLLYRDGEQVFSGTLRQGYQIQSGGSFVLGQEQDSVGGGFDPNQTYTGSIDEVRIWNVARSATEISENLNNTLTGTETGLVGYWNFDNDSATSNTITDLTNGNDGTFFNGQGNNIVTETSPFLGGNDTFIGGAGDDTLIGGAGNDSMNGDDGNDWFDAGSGSDSINGGAGNDWIDGGAGRDFINGGSGNGNDTLIGGGGNDVLDAWFGDDLVNGGDGNDLVNGEVGDDTLIGGLGADRFAYRNASEGGDTIVDFNSLEGDTIQISKSGFGGITDASNFSFNQGNLLFGQEQIAILQDVDVFNVDTDIRLSS